MKSKLDICERLTQSAGITTCFVPIASATKEEIDSATLENYIAYQSNISEEEIANLLEQDDLDKMKLDFNIDDATIEDALKSNSNLEQYLID